MMSKKLVTLIFVATTLLSSIASALDVHPYFGADQQLHRTRFKHGSGDNIFPKHHAQINVYSGLKADEYNASFEVGYLSTISKTRFVTINSRSAALGKMVSKELSPLVLKSYINLKGYHFNVVNFYSFPGHENLRFAGSVGVIWLKANAQSRCVSYSSPQAAGATRDFKKTQPVLRITVSPEYIFKNKLGIRSSVCFLNTSTMKITATPKETSPESRASIYNPTIRLKDNIVYSLGLFYEF